VSSEVKGAPVAEARIFWYVLYGEPGGG